jgi:two-component system, chemotaxis family, CheB/CheR fusion protein
MNLPPDSTPSDSDPKTPPDSPSAATPLAVSPEEFFVVGLGASAGGLDTITEVLRRLPARANLVLVIVQHLDPHHESLLVELLRRVSALPVDWATHGSTVQAGHVYVAPARTHVGLENGVLMLREPPAARPGGEIDFFFLNLAEDCKHRAVVVIASGNGQDGTAGARQVKGQGGLVFAQEPATASFPSMPRAAIDVGCVDRVLTPAGIAEELVKLTQNAPRLWGHVGAPSDELPQGDEGRHLTTVFRLLAARTGVDFSEYKQTTIKRRLVRQMVLAKVSDLAEFTRLLQKNREEIDRLYESLLINVTEFFRDQEYFDYLREHILPDIIAQHQENAPIRLWVPGASTGEEAYSLGIILSELLQERGLNHPVQIFGTDVSERAIAHARAGLFSAADVANVGPERLSRFFYETERGYMVQKPIRDMCVFARQNVVKDSPFSRLDLLSCRNLLIYLGPRVQRKLMPLFHYALNPGGYLVLGNSESVGSNADLFRLVDRRYRIYTRKSTGRRPTFEVSVEPSAPSLPPQPLHAMPDELKEPFDVIREADRIVLQRHGPNGVLVNEDLEILQFRGDVSPFLALSAGRASLHLLKMAREGLVAELESALNEARANGAPAHRSGISIIHGGTAKAIDIDVTPIAATQAKERFYLVLFAPAAPGASPDAGKKARGKKVPADAGIEQLRQDLHATRNYLQTTIEKHESTNQELRAANEEIQSSNEELQSTNEELETAKEELQSTNEELTTVNEELHSRQLELIQLNNDLTNLINSVHLPIIILGQDMRIRRFTPMAEKVLNVIPTDIGRPLSDLNINLKVEDLPRLMAEVMDSLTIRELEVQDSLGRWFSMRLRPYKTADNKIDGVVLTLIDIDEMKRTISALEEARDFSQAVVESTREPLAVLDAQLCIQVANDAFFRLFATSREHTRHRPVFDILHDRGRIGEFRSALEGIFPGGASLTAHEIEIELTPGRPSRLVIDARQIASGSRSYPLILVSIRQAH